MPPGKYRNPRPDTFHADTPSPDPAPFVRTAEHIAAEASKLNFWIFDPSTKEWHSPEEFLDKFGRIKVGMDHYLEQIQVRDPFEGIKAGFQRVLDTQIKLEDFTRRVVEYYRRS